MVSEDRANWFVGVSLITKSDRLYIVFAEWMTHIQWLIFK